MWAYKPVNSPAFSYIFAPSRKAPPVGRRTQAGEGPKTPGGGGRAPYPILMYEVLLVLTLSSPARAGVVTAAEAGAASGVPAISLQTGLNSTSAPTLGTALTVPDLALPAMTFKRESWRIEGKKLERLGSGTVGFVDVHPTAPGLVIKTINPSFDQLFNGLDHKTAAEADDKAAAELERAGAGPKVLATQKIAGHHVSIRERIFGKTMIDLMDTRGYGEEENRLVMEMLGRMAEKGAMVTDLVPSNVMIGTTERDAERKAYFIDGGMVESFPEGLEPEKRVDYILNYPQVVGIRQDPSNFKPIEMTKRFRSAVNEGLERSRPATRAQRFWQGLKRFFANAYIQPVH